MQLQNEHLKLSLIIYLFTEPFCLCFFFFSSFSQSTELILGVLKEKRSCFYEVICAYMYIHIYFCIKARDADLSRLLPTVLFYDLVLSSVILCSCSLPYLILLMDFSLSRKEKVKYNKRSIRKTLD